MKLLYVFQTRKGPFYIGEQDGRFHPMHGDKSLGSYAEAWQAAEDLAHGRTSGINTAGLGIPEDIGEWEKCIVVRLICPYIGEFCIDTCDFLVGLMLTGSCIIQMMAHAKASVVVKMRTKMEVNMETTINVMCVVAGIALLGRSGDMFPILQGKARVGMIIAV
ncbi:MAG: hypothetical protein HQK59_07285 [Deltaproteobacteria bacterium]|nr:hypothetical protein [Deltaproteobacteria bacterium]